MLSYIQLLQAASGALRPELGMGRGLANEILPVHSAFFPAPLQLFPFFCAEAVVVAGVGWGSAATAPGIVIHMAPGATATRP